MTWSLQLRNGDLTLGNASYGTVTGERKLVQDLRAYVLEQMGTDDMHPEFGSLIDGGRLPDGTEVQGTIGKMNTELARVEVEAELRRLINAFQARQLQRAKDDRIVYGKTTLTKGEVLLGLSDMVFTRSGDALSVVLVLQTAADTSPEVSLTLIS